MLPLEDSAILLIFIKLRFVIKTFVLSIFEWLFYTGFNVLENIHNFTLKIFVYLDLCNLCLFCFTTDVSCV